MIKVQRDVDSLLTQKLQLISGVFTPSLAILRRHCSDDKLYSLFMHLTFRVKQLLDFTNWLKHFVTVCCSLHI